MVLVVFPGGKDTEQALNTSIGRVAKIQAELLAAATPVVVTTTENLAKPEVGSFGRVLLTCFRPTDILSREWLKDVLRSDAKVCVAALIHEQDKACGYLPNAYNMTVKNGWIFGKLSKDSYASGVYIPAPIRRRIPEDIEGRKELARRIGKIEKPSLTVSCAPSIRKNSVFGMEVAIEAANRYGKPCKVNIHTRGTDVGKVRSFIKSIPVEGTVELNIYGALSQGEMDSLYRLSTTIFQPSIDEGLNMIPSEYGWIGNNIVMGKLPCNLEKRGINKSLFQLHESIVSGGKVGEDEIVGLVKMGFPSFQEVCSMLVRSLEEWEKTARTMRKRAISTVVMGENFRHFIDTATTVLGITKPYRKGRVTYL